MTGLTEATDDKDDAVPSLGLPDFPGYEYGSDKKKSHEEGSGGNRGNVFPKVEPAVVRVDAFDDPIPIRNRAILWSVVHDCGNDIFKRDCWRNVKERMNERV